ncbi:IS4/Tn5 family transposase DNA-binding protein, partial [Nostoc sp. 'Peltigera malacea cyanobiont' DB3992]
MAIGYALSLGFGKAVSEVFSSGTVLKRAYEFCSSKV